MNDMAGLVFAFIAGGLLGVFFYFGLWWTVKKGMSSTKPALWFGISMVARTVIALAVFYAVGGNHFQRLVACLAGFIIARLIITRFIRLKDGKQKKSPVEVVSDAP